jgi:hypothetical protein
MAQRFETLAYTNKFTFTCPIFDAQSTMGACMVLRDRVWQGKAPEKRQGCQVAMKCGKCPAAALVSMHIYDTRWDNDYHGSVEPKQGKLHAEVLAKVENVMIQDSVLNKFAVSPTERNLLLSATDRIREQLKTAPGEKPTRASDYTAPKRKRAAPAPAAAPASNVTDKMLEAAKSGDMAAAISQ